MEFISEIETALGKKAIKKFEPMHKGDVRSTFSDSESIQNWTGYRPNTSIKME